jgi:hypothetical protein
MQQVYEYGRIKGFEKRILAEGLCKAFLPMSFISFDGKDMANIDCSGYRVLTAFELRNGMETVSLLENCAFALTAACDSLINPRKMELNTKTVFIAPDKKEVRFVYIPRNTPVDNIADLLMELIGSMDGSIVKGEATAYLRACASYLESSYSLANFATYLDELKHDIRSQSLSEKY